MPPLTHPAATSVALTNPQPDNALPFEAPSQNEGPAQSTLEAGPYTMTAMLTFYDCLGQGFCGEMANGVVVHEAAAACSYDLALGTMFMISGDPTGRTYTCEDRGLLVNTHVDIFFNDPADGYRWQAQMGMSGTLEIISPPVQAPTDQPPELSE
jgi:hypothetical protein